MKSNNELIKRIENNLKNILFNYFDAQDFDNYNNVIKSIITQITDNDSKVEYVYQDIYDENSDYLEFKSLDANDESKYLVYINEYRINDSISDISTSKNTDEKRQLSLELLYNVISKSYIVANQYKNRTSNDIEQNLIGINNLLKQDTQNKVTYLQRKNALDNLRYNIEEALSGINDENRKYIIDSLKKYEDKEIKEASISNMKDNILKMKMIVEEYKLYPNEEEKDVFKRLLDNYKNKEEALSKYMDGNQESYEFSEPGDKITNLTRALNGNMEIDYDKIENSIGNYSGNIERKIQLISEIEKAENILNSNNLNLDIDDSDVSDRIKKLYDDIEKDNEEFESIDPDATVKQYIIDNYPEMSIVLGKYLEKADLENVIKNLPDEVKNEVEEVVTENGKNFDEFISEIEKKNKSEKSKLERKVNKFNEKYGDDLYQEYKKFTSKEKEDFFKYSTIDDSVARGILDRLKAESDSIQADVRKEEVSNIANREYKDKDTNNIVDDYYKFKEIREQNIPNANKIIIEKINDVVGDNKELNDIFIKYLSADDVAKALNNIEYKDLVAIREKLNIDELVEQLDREIKIPYTDYVDNLGKNLLDTVKYKSDEELEVILNSAKSEKEKEEIIGIGKYSILKQNNQEMDDINTIEKSIGNTFKDENYLSAKRYCELRHQAVIYNLTEKAALNNVRVEENTDIGLQTLKNKIIYIDGKEIEVNRHKLKNGEERGKSLTDIKDKLTGKISKALDISEKNIKNKLDKNNGQPGISYI